MNQAGYYRLLKKIEYLQLGSNSHTILQEGEVLWLLPTEWYFTLVVENSDQEVAIYPDEITPVPPIELLAMEAE